MATTHETCHLIIPAKAGIQAVDIPPRSGTTPQYDFVRYAVLFDRLDSGLRQNGRLVDSKEYEKTSDAMDYRLKQIRL